MPDMPWRYILSMRTVERFRDFYKMRTVNQGHRTLIESIIAPEVEAAVKDWIKGGAHGVLIGGLALSFHGRPRYTQNIDILSTSDVPHSIPGFKKHREHAFGHQRTGVEIEVLKPEHIKMLPMMAQHITNTAIEVNGAKVASPEGLVASKLHRFSLQDKADIHHLVHSGKANKEKLWGGFPLTDEHKKRFSEIEANSEG